MTERELTSFDKSKLPNVVEGTIKNPILCPKCSSRNIATIYNSTTLLDRGGVDVYFHIFCNACWQEFPMLLAISPTETFCTCAPHALIYGTEKRDMSYKIRIKDVLDICIQASAQIHIERKQLREDASRIPFYRVIKASHKNWEAALHKGKELSFCTRHIKAVGLSRGAYCFLSPEDAAMLYDLHRDYVLDLKN